MTPARIAGQRLRNQHLLTTTFTNPVDVVRSLGAVQSQDYANAKWAVAQRARGATEADLERAVTTGSILRTHVLRPTWHFVLPEDARWMLALTAARITRVMGYYNSTLGLDAAVFHKSHRALERALRDGEHATRTELAHVLKRAGVDVSTGQHLGRLLMQAEQDLVIISGARRGKQLTYALFDERVPPAPPRERDESLVDLTQRYFATRGPATLQDFAWWSGLTVGDARRGVEAAGSTLARDDRDDRVHWYSPATRDGTRPRRNAHLLPNYDEYFVGFKDRTAVTERLRRRVVNARFNALGGHVVVVDGQIVGAWRRTAGDTVDVQIDLLVPLTVPERALVQRAAERFGAFLGVPVYVRYRRTPDRRSRAPALTARRRRDQSLARDRR